MRHYNDDSCQMFNCLVNRIARVANVINLNWINIREQLMKSICVIYSNKNSFYDF